ncbi:MAG: GAF domain-containing protein [Bacteroidota bacterium]
MEPSLKIIQGSKEEKYHEVIPQIKSLLEGENDLIGALANVTAVLKMSFEEFNWVGFYFLKNTISRASELVLGPFQGKPACTRIRVGEGVCGKSVELKQSLVVPDVSKFPGHIYCDANSRSEIVVPLVRNKKVLGVLDIDSDRFGTFDKTHQEFLEKIVAEVVRKF